MRTQKDLMLVQTLHPFWCCQRSLGDERLEDELIQINFDILMFDLPQHLARLLF